MKRSSQWAIVAAMLMCMAFVFYRPPAKPAVLPGEGVEVGLKAPDFNLEDLDSRSYSLASFRGKPTIINFWASWCGPCADEAPSFAKLDQAHGSEIQIVAINLTTLDAPDKVRQFVQKYDYRFPVLLDTTGQTAAAYKIRPIPSTFFLDKSGVIADSALGTIDPQTLERKALALLAGP